MTELTDVARQAAGRIITRGWHQGDWTGPDGEECLHQAVQRCNPQTGDGYLVSAVLTAQGYTTGWQDGLDDVEGREEVLRLLKTVEVTDADLADTFGPQWRPVVGTVRQAAQLDAHQTRDLAAARVGSAAWSAAGDAARSAAGAAARSAAGAAARSAARSAAWSAARSAATVAATVAAGAAASDAARAVVVADLVGRHGLAQDHIDTLLDPWRQVVGDPLEAAR